MRRLKLYRTQVPQQVLKYLRAQPRNVFIDKRIIRGFVPKADYALMRLVKRGIVESRMGPGGGYRLAGYLHSGRSRPDA